IHPQKEACRDHVQVTISVHVCESDGGAVVSCPNRSDIGECHEAAVTGSFEDSDKTKGLRGNGVGATVAIHVTESDVRDIIWDFKAAVFKEVLSVFEGTIASTKVRVRPGHHASIVNDD